MPRVILIRSQYPDSRIDKEAEALVDNGYNVTFLAWNRNNLPVNCEPKKYRIICMNLSVPAGNIKVAFFLPFWWLFIVYKLFIMKWDIVHAADFDTYIPALIVSKVKRKYIIYDIFDFYAEMIGFPIFPKLSRNIISKIDRFFMKFADAIIIADDSRISQIGKSSNKYIITINNSPKEELCNSNITVDNKEIFTIFYGGMISEDRGIVDVISAVQNLTDVHLLIMGPFSSPKFKNQVYQICSNLRNVTIHGDYVPHSKIITYTINADLLFAIYDTSTPNNVFSSPNKLFESMMCGKPILVNDGTSMSNIVRKYNCGVVISYGDIEEIREKIIKLKSDCFLRGQLGENGKKAYYTKYSWKIMEKRLLTIYSQLLRE